MAGEREVRAARKTRVLLGAQFLADTRGRASRMQRRRGDGKACAIARPDRRLAQAPGECYFRGSTAACAWGAPMDDPQPRASRADDSGNLALIAPQRATAAEAATELRARDTVIARSPERKTHLHAYSPFANTSKDSSSGPESSPPWDAGGSYTPAEDTYTYLRRAGVRTQRERGGRAKRAERSRAPRSRVLLAPNDAGQRRCFTQRSGRGEGRQSGTFSALAQRHLSALAQRHRLGARAPRLGQQPPPLARSPARPARPRGTAPDAPLRLEREQLRGHRRPHVLAEVVHHVRELAQRGQLAGGGVEPHDGDGGGQGGVGAERLRGAVVGGVLQDGHLRGGGGGG